MRGAAGGTLSKGSLAAALAAAAELRATAPHLLVLGSAPASSWPALAASGAAPVAFLQVTNPNPPPNPNPNP